MIELRTPKNWPTRSTSASRQWLRRLSSQRLGFVSLQLRFNGYDNNYNEHLTWDFDMISALVQSGLVGTRTLEMPRSFSFDFDFDVFPSEMEKLQNM